MEDNLIRATGFRLILAICLGAYLVRHTGATTLTDVFAVEIVGDPAVANSIAAKYGFKVLSHLEHFGGVYEFVSNEVGDRSKRSDEDLSAELALDPRVTWVEQQRVLHRQKRVDAPNVSEEGEDGDALTFNDPLFKNQWYLIDRGQSGGFGGHDLNVAPAWKKGLSGKGVVVTIVDDGVDHKHPDLQLNYDPMASADLNDPDDPFNDPTPNMVDPGNNHGTKCAGVVAALANNSKCGVGVAFNAKIGGIRMLDGVVTDLLESRSLLYNNQYIDIYSSSWGPKDNGSVMDGPHRYTRKALENGAKKGRGGKGSIFIWATGNGGHHGDDCNCDGYITSIYTLTVGSIASNGNVTSFSEICPSTMAVVFTSGMQSNKDFAHVVTTDAGGKCTKYFVGTSTAAPLAAGCVALVLEANGNLTWRDVQHIVAETSVVPNEEEDGWTVNGGGYHVNHKYGFGAMDCSRMVEAALSWSLVQEQKSCIVRSTMKPRVLMACETITESLVTDNFCNKTSTTSDSIDRLEHVQVYVKMSHVKRGDISINITSPSGTTSNILKVRPLDTSKNGINFIFMTVHNWGESPVGRWTLTVKDNCVDGGEKVGELENWALGFNGVQGELANHEKWRMSDGHLLRDGRIAGTKLENRRRVLEQRHLVSPRTTTPHEEQQQHSDDNDSATQNDNEGRIINEHRNINEDPIINEDNVDTFRGYKMAQEQNNGNGNATNGDEEEEDGDDDDDDDNGDDDGSHAGISDDKLYNLLARLKAINRRNRLLEEQRIARRGFLGGHQSNRGRSPQWGGA